MIEQDIRTFDDLLKSLDHLFANEQLRWNKFFGGLPADHPLATDLPDEHLVRAINNKTISPGVALDIGCGNGRNSIYLARHGFKVDANDISQAAIIKTEAAALKANVQVNCILGAFYDIEATKQKYDLIYDLGCLHHVHPHRRPQYIDFVCSTLKPGGFFFLGCFNEKMGTMKSDAELFRSFDMEGGLSISAKKLHHFFDSQFELIEMRPMKTENSEQYGVGWDHISVFFWKKRR